MLQRIGGDTCQSRCTGGRLTSQCAGARTFLPRFAFGGGIARQVGGCGPMRYVQRSYAHPTWLPVSTYRLDRTPRVFGDTCHEFNCTSLQQSALRTLAIGAECTILVLSAVLCRVCVGARIDPSVTYVTTCQRKHDND